MEKRLIIQDNICGEIVFEKDFYDLRKITGTREFKRLYSVRQLGLTNRNFSMSNITRHSHSLGVFQNATEWFKNVSFKEQTTLEEQREVLAACLLHDIGHGPLSHDFEILLEGKYNHEEFTSAVILDTKSEVNQVLKELNINPENVAAIIDHNLEKVKLWQVQMVSSQVDCDRLDYFNRDANAIGLKGKQVDVIRIFDNSELVKVNDELQIVFSDEIKGDLIKMLVERFDSYSNVYVTNKSEEPLFLVKKMLERIKEMDEDETIESVLRRDPLWSKVLKIILNSNGEDLYKNIGLKNFLFLEDNTFLAFLKKIDIYSKDSILREYSDSFFGKSNFKCVIDCEESKDFKEINGSEYKLIYEQKMHGTKFYKPNEPILLKYGNGKIKDLGKLLTKNSINDLIDNEDNKTVKVYKKIIKENVLDNKNTLKNTKNKMQQ
ncbi:MAG: HD domain-containing protein [Mycoplasma sp.]